MSVLIETPDLWDILAELHRQPFNLKQCGKQAQCSSKHPVQPLVDVHEDESAYHISVELPGINKESIHVQHKDTALIIKGEFKDEYAAGRDEKDGEQPKWTRVITERQFGTFQRTLDLGRRADFGKISASLNEGLLKIEIGKKAVDADWTKVAINDS